MNKVNRIKNYIKCDGYTIKRLYVKKDAKLLEDLTALFIKNIEHLYYWHGTLLEFQFKNMYDYIRYLRNYDVFCYVIIVSGKIIGFIGVSKLFNGQASLKYRFITYWIDKDHAGRGIMSSAISTLEETLAVNTDYLRADAYSDNIASIMLLEKLNYIKQYSSMGFDRGMPYNSYQKFLKKDNGQKFLSVETLWQLMKLAS